MTFETTPDTCCRDVVVALVSIYACWYGFLTRAQMFFESAAIGK